MNQAMETAAVCYIDVAQLKSFDSTYMQSNLVPYFPSASKELGGLSYEPSLVEVSSTDACTSDEESECDTFRSSDDGEATVTELQYLKNKMANALKTGSAQSSSPPAKNCSKPLSSASTTVSDLNESLLECDSSEEAPAKEKLMATTGSTTNMAHSQVPRKKNMEELHDSGKREPPTTLMIRNIPTRYTQPDLANDLKNLGFAGMYDFLYMPMDRRTGASVGYAFVNFISPLFAKMCVELLGNFYFTCLNKTTKRAIVSVAHLQGLEKNLEHYKEAAVSREREAVRRPVIGRRNA